MQLLWDLVSSPLARPALAVLLGAGLICALALRIRNTAFGRAVRLPGAVERILILGSGRLARELIHELKICGPRWTLVGVVSDVPPPDPAGLCPVMGSLEELDACLAKVRPHRVVVALDENRGRLPIDALLDSRARGIAVERGVTFYERLTHRLAIDSLTPSALIFSNGFNRRRVAAIIGRGTSVLLSATTLVLTLPLWPLIALAIRLDSPGPVIFRQERVGRGARTFTLMKFRSMHVEGARRSAWVADNTDRITRVGRFLRWSHLDELPQLLNILRGDMNLVGPRPHPVSNYALFNAGIPFYHLRSTIRPGMTGWAQVRYRYANTLQEESEKMRYDLYYIKHRSPWLDLRIVWRTARIVLLGHRPEGLRAGAGSRSAPGTVRAA